MKNRLLNKSKSSNISDNGNYSYKYDFCFYPTYYMMNNDFEKKMLNHQQNLLALDIFKIIINKNVLNINDIFLLMQLSKQFYVYIRFNHKLWATFVLNHHLFEFLLLMNDDTPLEMTNIESVFNFYKKFINNTELLFPKHDFYVAYNNLVSLKYNNKFLIPIFKLLSILPYHDECDQKEQSDIIKNQMIYSNKYFLLAEVENQFNNHIQLHRLKIFKANPNRFYFTIYELELIIKKYLKVKRRNNIYPLNKYSNIFYAN